MNIQQPPFPAETESEAIVGIGIMFGSFMVFIILLILMIYCCKENKDFVLKILMWLFSIIFSFESITSEYFPFTPTFQIFFMLFQTILFFISSLDNYIELRNKKKGY